MKRKRGKDKTKRKSKLGRNLAIGAGVIGLGAVAISEARYRAKRKIERQPDSNSEANKLAFKKSSKSIAVNARKKELGYSNAASQINENRKLLNTIKSELSRDEYLKQRKYARSERKKAAASVKKEVAIKRKAGTYFSFPTSSSHLADFSEGKKVMRAGRAFTPNKPVPSTRPGKKKMVLASKKVGNKTKYKLLHFGDSSMKDFRQHKSKKRQKSYLARSGGIKNKNGELTKNDKFSANYWSRKVLW